MHWLEHVSYKSVKHSPDWWSETLFYEFWFDARCLDHNYNQGQNVMNSDTVLCKAMENKFKINRVWELVDASNKDTCTITK